MRHDPQRLWQLGAAALLVAASVAVYLPALDAPFVSDDGENIVGNDNLRSASGLWATWTQLRGPQGPYYPLTYTTYWIEHHLWGLQPRGYHAVNILLHALNGVVLWRVLRRLRIGAAWFAAAAFALHPAQAESVAWITERRNVLSTLFLLAATWSYLRARPQDDAAHSGRNARLWYGLTVVAFLAALLSKTVTLVLPPALLLMIWWRRGRLVRADLLSVAPLFALGAAAALLTWGAEGELIREWELAWMHRGLGERLALAGKLVWFYAGTLVWPAKLAFVYPRSVLDPTLIQSWLPALALVILFAALVSLRWRIGRGPLSASLWFVGALLPVLGLVDFFYLIYSDAADRFLYLPSMGPLALVAASAAALASSRGATGRKVMALLGLTLLAALGTMTYERSKVFASPEALYSDTIAKYPQSWGAQLSLGTVLVAEGRSAEAIPHLEVSRRLQPTVPGASTYLAIAYAQVGRTQEALVLFDEALRLAPGDLLARSNLGLTLSRLGRDAEAATELRRVLDVDPAYAGTRQALLSVLLKLMVTRGRSGRVEEALGLAREASALAEAAGARDLQARLDAFIRDGGATIP